MNESEMTMPLHIGIIMDGNRRWARSRGLQPWRGHAKGQEILRRIAKHAFKSGVKYLSVYAFSTENWQRDDQEVGYLMRHVGIALKKYLHEFMEAGVRVVFLGQRDGLSKSVLRAMDSAMVQTAHNTAATLAICFNYGGQQEIADACKQIIAEKTNPEVVTPEVIASHLCAPEVPLLDLVIRTSGERRLSNFMLWRAAYAELYFTKTFWPDFTESDLDAALHEYVLRQRRFGN